jgi:nucleoside-diphosphate-sugar epimerase
MHIFITGGSGFIGQALIKHLIARGHQVSALSRSQQSDAVLISLGTAPIRGDLENAATLHTCLLGIDTVVHAAAPVSFWGERSWFHQQIVDASETLAKAAIKAGVKRFIYLSSEATLQNKAPLIDIDEQAPYPEQNNSIYGEAKRLAEQCLLSMQSEIDMLVLRPSFVWGNNSPNLNKIIAKAKAGEFFWMGDAEQAFEAVHIGNLVNAINCSLHAGHTGEVYFITDNKPYTVKSFFEPIFKRHQITRRIRHLPTSIGTMAATMVEKIWHILHLKSTPPLLRFEVAFLTQSRRYRIDKAITELGYQPDDPKNFLTPSMTLNTL